MVDILRDTLEDVDEDNTHTHTQTRTHIPLHIRTHSHKRALARTHTYTCERIHVSGGLESLWIKRGPNSALHGGHSKKYP